MQRKSELLDETILETECTSKQKEASIVMENV